MSTTAFKIDEERDEQADYVITETAVILALAGAFNSVPLVGDVAAIVGGWGTMLYRIANIYEAKFDEEWLRKSMFEIAKSGGWYLAGTGAFVTVVGLFKWTGIGTVPAMIVNALLNAGFTVAVGNMYKEAWRVGQTPTEEELALRIHATIGYARSSENRKRARAVYDQARADGLSREKALEEVVKVMSEAMKTWSEESTA